MGLPEPQKDQRYTYKDYCTWDDDERWELIDGVPYAMSPAPTPAHQRISGELYFQLASFLKGKLCQVFYSPFDVRLNAAGDDDYDVFQPDLLVVCDRAKIDDKGLNGAPDMAIEIISPYSARRDRVLKFNHYLQAGVREYWIVDAEIKTVQTCILKNGEYIVKAYTETDAIPVHVLDGCTINLSDVFAE